MVLNPRISVFHIFQLLSLPFVCRLFMYKINRITPKVTRRIFTRIRGLPIKTALAKTASRQNGSARLKWFLVCLPMTLHPLIITHMIKGK